MNRDRRAELRRLQDRIDAVRQELESIRDDLDAAKDAEQAYIDDMPENLQGSENAQKAERAVEAMDEVLGTLESVNQELEDTAPTMENAAA